MVPLQMLTADNAIRLRDALNGVASIHLAYSLMNYNDDET